MKNKGILLAIPAVLLVLVALAIAAVLPAVAQTQTVQIVTAQVGSATSSVSVSYVTNDSASNVNKLRVRVVDDLATGATTSLTLKNTTFTGAGSDVSPFTVTRWVGEDNMATTTTATSTAFVGEVEIVSTATSGKIVASHGDVIKATYTPSGSPFAKVAQVTVDSRRPAISGLSPASGLSTKSTSFTFQADITDPDSKIATEIVGVVTRPISGSIKFVIGLSSTTTLTGTDLTYTAITDGWTAKFSGDLGTYEGSVSWYFEATDSAGNKGRSDSDTTTSCNPYTGVDCQNQSLTIDQTKPIVGRARTGKGYDTTAKKLISARNSVMVEFIKTGTTDPDTSGNIDKLDATTIDVADFTVEGASVTGIVFPNVSATASTDAGGDGVETRNRVFITLAADLAPDAKPTVRLVGSVNDLAGNTQSAGEKIAEDFIAPKFTITITGDVATPRPAAKSKITIRVQPDEELNIDGARVVLSVLTATTTTPFVTINGSGDQAVLGASSVAGAVRTFEVSSTLTSNPGSGTKRLVNVCVYGADLNNANVGATGQGGSNCVYSSTLSKNLVNLSKAYLFEFDNGLPDPSVTLNPAVVGSTTQTDSTSPILKISFSGEGTEYTFTDNDADGSTDSITVSAVKTEVDTQNGVTLTKVTLDGTSMTSQIGTISSNSFMLSTSGLALGAHTLLVNGTDALGNTLASDFKFEFTVVARAAHKISLVPGWNLISFPGDPTDSEINAVLAGNAAISMVLSYDPADTKGPWLVANRNATTGKLEGTLTTIGGGRGYWVQTTTFDSVSTLLAQRAFSQLPPTIPVVAGWNLVPVADLALQAIGTNVDPDNYFASVTWTVAYYYDASTNAWTKIVPLDGANPQIKLGWALWLFATKSGSLVP